MFTLNTLIHYFKKNKISDYTKGTQHEIDSNVGICISGGGSRSLTAGMGQLRGLKNLKINGKPLLEQTKAISVVSGGSWVGTTFTYLPNHYKDEDFLGKYLAPNQYNMQNISYLHNDCIGKRVTSDFSPEDLALQSIILISQGIPKNKIWHNLVGTHILEHYGLNKENSFFTFDNYSLQNILKQNNQLSRSTAYLVNQTSPRPFLICNTSMFIRKKDSIRQNKNYCAPIQITPVFIGTYMQSNKFITAQSLEPISNSAINSYAFDSQPIKLSSQTAQVQKKTLFSLTDAQCSSSAFFAGIVENLGKDFVKDKVNFKKIMRSKTEKLSLLQKSLIPKKHHNIFQEIFSEAEKFLKKGEKKIDEFLDEARVFINDTEDIALQFAGKLKNLIPAYKYWSPSRNSTNKVKANKFADGGILENSGIPALLVYEDINKIIAFINTEAKLQKTSHGIVDSLDRQIPETNILIDEWVPTLFGYQPYVKNKGYMPFCDISKSKYFSYKYNQVFRQSAFQILLKGLWAAANGHAKQTSGANFKQHLTTVANKIHGVRAGRKIEILWSYLDENAQWQKQLSPAIQQKILPNLMEEYNFPHYSVFHTDLSPEQVNLLASLTSWNIVAGNPALFKSMYAKQQCPEG